MTRAEYLCLVSQACPGLFNNLIVHGRPISGEHFIRYHLPQERGWAYVHMAMLRSGIPTVWPRRQDNADGRWWGRLMKWWTSRKS